MPETVGVRELKNQTSRVIKAVAEENAEYVVTLHGEPVAIIRPLNGDERRRLREAEANAATARLDALAERVAAEWTSDKSPAEIISEQRR